MFGKDVSNSEKMGLVNFLVKDILSILRTRLAIIKFRLLARWLMLNEVKSINIINSYILTNLIRLEIVNVKLYMFYGLFSV